MKPYGLLAVLACVLMFMPGCGSTYPWDRAEEAVAQIVGDVRREGDVALRDYTQRIDGVALDTIELDAGAIEAAPGLLAATVITGIVGHVLRYYLQWPLSTYAMYVVHLAVAVPMLLIEVPFGKWAHLLYRPFAIYFASVRIAAREEARRAAPEAGAVRQAA